jgi:exosortase
LGSPVKNRQASKNPVSQAPAIEGLAGGPVTLTSWAILLALGGSILWAHWPTFREMGQKWSSDPQYSHAFLVPLFSLFLLWVRREQVSNVQCDPSWWGATLLAIGVGLRLAGAYTYFDWIEAISLLPLLAGAALLLGGRPVLRWAWLSIAFLLFMVPLPYRVETALSQPLQRLATVASTYVLQTLGRPAISEGNVIIVNQARLGVVEACNGLGMLLLFFAMAAGVAILSRRGLVDKLVIFASAVPIAVMANVIRITTAGLLHEALAHDWADLVFHEWLAGPYMMALALGMLGMELVGLSYLFVEVPSARATPRGAAGLTSPSSTVNNASSRSLKAQLR